MTALCTLSAASLTAFAAETSPSDAAPSLIMPDSMSANAAAGDTVSKSLTIMWQGMLGIFVVMLLIYLTVVILNAVTKNKKDK